MCVNPLITTTLTYISFSSLDLFSGKLTVNLVAVLASPLSKKLQKQFLFYNVTSIASINDCVIAVKILLK